MEIMKDGRILVTALIITHPPDIHHIIIAFMLIDLRTLGCNPSTYVQSTLRQPASGSSLDYSACMYVCMHIIAGDFGTGRKR